MESTPHGSEHLRAELVQQAQLISRVDRLESYLRSEIGYASDSQGNINRRVMDIANKVDEHEIILRGRGSQLGVIGWHQLILRSWWGLIVAFTAVVSYVLGSFFPLPHP